MEAHHGGISDRSHFCCLFSPQRRIFPPSISSLARSLLRLNYLYVARPPPPPPPPLRAIRMRSSGELRPNPWSGGRASEPRESFLLAPRDVSHTRDERARERRTSIHAATGRGEETTKVAHIVWLAPHVMPTSLAQLIWLIRRENASLCTAPEPRCERKNVVVSHLFPE